MKKRRGVIPPLLVWFSARSESLALFMFDEIKMAVSVKVEFARFG